MYSSDIFILHYDFTCILVRYDADGCVSMYQCAYQWNILNNWNTYTKYSIDHNCLNEDE